MAKKRNILSKKKDEATLKLTKDDIKEFAKETLEEELETLRLQEQAERDKVNRKISIIEKTENPTAEDVKTYKKLKLFQARLRGEVDMKTMSAALGMSAQAIKEELYPDKDWEGIKAGKYLPEK